MNGSQLARHEHPRESTAAVSPLRSSVHREAPRVVATSCDQGVRLHAEKTRIRNGPRSMNNIELEPNSTICSTQLLARGQQQAPRDLRRPHVALTTDTKSAWRKHNHNGDGYWHQEHSTEQSKLYSSETQAHAHPLVYVSAAYECSCTVALAFFSMETQESAGNAPAGVKANEVAEIKNQRQSTETLTDNCDTNTTAGITLDFFYIIHTLRLFTSIIRTGKSYTQHNGVYIGHLSNTRTKPGDRIETCVKRYATQGTEPGTNIQSPR